MKTRYHNGSVIAITVLFMSFLLIGIVGAAYLLSSHLRVTSLGADYLQATYNAESALELSLFELKHRREGYERPPLELSWTPGEPPQNLLRSEISYRVKEDKPEEIPLSGGSRKLALFYEDVDGTIHDLKDMRGLTMELGAYAQQPSTGTCLEVRLVGKYEQTGEFDSISTSLPCAKDSLRALGSLVDPLQRTSALPSNQPYPFDQFIQDHTEVLLLVNDYPDSLRGAGATSTIASPQKSVVAEGIFGGSVIRKGITLWQDQLPDLLSRSLVQ